MNLLKKLFRRKYNDCLAVFLAKGISSHPGFIGRIMVYKKRSFSRNDKKGVQDALVDLLLLSGTKYIIGSYLSTFTETAWWFGQCEARVEIVT
jgi:hypothetical protein